MSDFPKQMTLAALVADTHLAKLFEDERIVVRVKGSVHRVHTIMQLHNQYHIVFTTGETCTHSGRWLVVVSET